MVDGEDLLRRIARAGASMDPALSDRDVERMVAGSARRRRRRFLHRLVFTGATVSVLALALVVSLQRKSDPVWPGIATKPPEPARPLSGQASLPRMLRLSDGSTAMSLDLATDMTVAEDTKDLVVVALSRGRGRFEVTPRPARPFVVNVGEVTISVLGTVFTVERIADRVGLTVEQGTVRVDWGAGSAILKPGDEGWYPPLGMGVQNASEDVPVAKGPLTAGRPARRSPLSASAKDPNLLTKPATMADPAGAARLLLAADEARLAGHPGQGVSLLKQLLRDHRGDTRAPLAAFTLGRILLMELARPREAAAAFAEARGLSPSGPLAEDALAREIEALSQAGAGDQAKARAQEYLRLYPEGRRAAAVRAMVGNQ
jgi:transmembrane sensor